MRRHTHGKTIIPKSADKVENSVEGKQKHAMTATREPLRGDCIRTDQAEWRRFLQQLHTASVTLSSRLTVFIIRKYFSVIRVCQERRRQPPPEKHFLKIFALAASRCWVMFLVCRHPSN